MQDGLQTRHITTVAITTACRNATHSANLQTNMGTRAMISPALRSRVSKVLHEQHTGATRMKMIARRYVYWHIGKEFTGTLKTG